MDVEAIPRFLRRASFDQIVWLAPAAYAVHILEEMWQFPAWVSTYIAPGFTATRFAVANSVIMLALLTLTVLVSTVSVRVVDFVYFCWIAGQLLENALFHMGATAYFGVYSPGLLSAILIYMPVCYCIARAAHREGRLGNSEGLAALAVGAAGMFALAYFGLPRRIPWLD